MRLIERLRPNVEVEIVTATRGSCSVRGSPADGLGRGEGAGEVVVGGLDRRRSALVSNILSGGDG